MDKELKQNFDKYKFVAFKLAKKHYDITINSLKEISYDLDDFTNVALFSIYNSLIKYDEKKDKKKNLFTFVYFTCRNDIVTFVRTMIFKEVKKKQKDYVYSLRYNNNSCGGAYHIDLLFPIDVKLFYKEVEKSLSKSNKKLLKLFLKGYTVKEISDMFGFTIDSVKSMKSKLYYNIRKTQAFKEFKDIFYN